MSEKGTGYYRVEMHGANLYAKSTLLEIVHQLEMCDYRCEAGSLSLNLAFMEFKHRAEKQDAPCNDLARFAVYPPNDPYSVFYACAAHLADVVEDGYIVRSANLPPGETCCFFARG